MIVLGRPKMTEDADEILGHADDRQHSGTTRGDIRVLWQLNEILTGVDLSNDGLGSNETKAQPTTI